MNALKILPILILLSLLASLASPSFPTTPNYVIKTLDSYNPLFLPAIKLSPYDNTKIAVSFFNSSTFSFQYKIINSNNQSICSKPHQNSTRTFLDWPQGSGLLFLAQDNVTLNHYKQNPDSCTYLTRLVTLQRKPQLVTPAPSDHYISLLTKSNTTLPTVQQYNIQTSSFIRQFIFTAKDILKTLIYSQNHQYLYLYGTFSNTSQSKVLAYDTVTGELKFQILSTYKPLSILHDFKSFLTLQDSVLYRVNETGDPTPLRILTQTQLFGCFLPQQNLFLTVNLNNATKTFQLLSYNTETGANNQKITLDFFPVPMKQAKILECRGQRALFLGSDGVVRIFLFNNSSLTLPLWAIILICTGIVALLVVGGLVIYIRKKINASKQISLLSEQN